jgi:hypothetical protein
MATGETSGARQMKLLTELPHVGAEPMTTPVASPARTLKSTHPAFAEYGDVESEEYLTHASRGSAKRFVDQAHIDERDHDDYLTDQENLRRPGQRHRSSQPLAQRQRQPNHKPQPKSVIGRLFCGAHEQVAPFAGLIVTAALVAAAGLLFHMMSGGGQSNAELDEFALPGFQVEALDESLPSSQSATLAGINSTPEITGSESLDIEQPELAPAEATSQNAHAIEASVRNSSPDTEPTVEPTMPLGQLSFPQTGTPLALDYSKATDPDLQQLPTVAERTEATATEAINR